MSRLLLQTAHESGVRSAMFNASGTRLVTCSDRRACVWDDSLRLVDVATHAAITFAGDVPLLVRHDDLSDPARPDWGYRSRGIVSLFARGLASGDIWLPHHNEVLVRIDASGAVAARTEGVPSGWVATRDDASAVIVWGQQRAAIVAGDRVTMQQKKLRDIKAVALHPAEPLAAIVEEDWTGRNLVVVDLAGAELASMELGAITGSTILGAHFTADGRIAVLSMRETMLTVIDWTKEGEHAVFSFDTRLGNDAVAFNREGTRFVTGLPEGGVALFDTLGFSAAPKALATVTSTVVPATAAAWDPKTRSLLALRTDLETWSARGLVRKLKRGARATLIAARTDGVLLGWDWDSPKAEIRSGSTLGTTVRLQKLRCASSAVQHEDGRVAVGGNIFAPDGVALHSDTLGWFVARLDEERLVTVRAFEPKVRVVGWDGVEQRVIDPPRSGRVVGLASGGGAFALGFEGSDGSIELWSDVDAKPQSVPIWLSSATMAFSPDGATLAVLALTTLHLIDMKKLEITRTIDADLPLIGGSLAFVSDAVLATSSLHGGLRLWDLRSDAWLELVTTEKSEWAAWSSDSRFEGTPRAIAQLSRVSPGGVAGELGAPSPGLLAEWLTP